jgi:two-component system, cell cycle response regulator
MNDVMLKVLLIESDADQSSSVLAMLEEVGGGGFSPELVSSLEGGLARLVSGGIDLVFTELTLVDSAGINTFQAIHSRYPELPVVILTSAENGAMAMRAVQQGAQYHLIKGSLNGELLVQTSRYAVEYSHLLDELRELTLTDDLTGLYNRRGFSNLAHQQLRVAARNGSRMLIIYIDLDGLKEINDRLGHAEGDIALIETASILKSTFRGSDIIARVGGDEFVVLLLESTDKESAILRERLVENLRERNQRAGNSFRLAFSSGCAECGPEDIFCTLDEMIQRADALMYEEKRAKKTMPILRA